MTTPEPPTISLDALLAFLAFYVSLATVFVPLTFGLAATLKDHFRGALDRRALGPRHHELVAFRDQFFYYNDAFSQLIVGTSILGIALTGALAWFFASRREAGLCERVFVLGLLLALWSFTCWYCADRHGALLRGFLSRKSDNRRPPSWHTDWRGKLSELIYVFQTGERIKLICNLTLTSGRNSFARRTRPVRGLLFLNLVLLTLAALLIAGFFDPRLAIPFLAIHAVATLYLWWELYSAWAPFSVLLEFEGATESAAYADRFLRDPAKEQQDTYATFMYQYEQDDQFRAGEEAIAECFRSLRERVKNNEIGLAEWAEQAKKAKHLDLTVPVLYVGVGYGRLMKSLGEGVKTLVGSCPELFGIDSVTLAPTSGAEVKRRNPGATLIAGDVFRFLGELAEPSAWPKEHVVPYSRLRFGPVRPLVVLLNTTYGALIDPALIGRSVDPIDPPKELLSLQRDSCASFLTALNKAFPSGFGLLVHSKKTGWRPSTSMAPYTRDNWLELPGTDASRGVFFLGRYYGSTLYLMLARWISSADFREEIDQFGQKAPDAEVVRGCVEQSQLSPGSGNSPYVWCGATVTARQRPSARLWRGLENLPDKDYSVAAEVKIADGVIAGHREVFEHAIVLDIGCGDGTFIEQLGLKSVDYVGFELNEAFVAQAVSRKLNAKNWHELRHVAVSPGSPKYVVVLWNVLHYLGVDDLEEVRSLLDQLVSGSTSVHVLVSTLAEDQPNSDQLKFSDKHRLNPGTAAVVAGEHRFLDLKFEGRYVKHGAEDIKEFYGPQREPYFSRVVMFGEVKRSA